MAINSVMFIYMGNIKLNIVTNDEVRSMREYVVIYNEIRCLQEQINLILGQKGFLEYDKVLILSQRLDEIINEWIRAKGFAYRTMKCKSV